jgi:hypothetical protein
MARMMPVVKFPSWGWPEESSKIEPTAAMAAMQDAPRKILLFGLIGITR